CEVVLQRCHSHPLPGPEGPREGPPAHRELKALERGVHMCSSPWCRGGGIGDDDRSAIGALARHHAQQLALRGPSPTPHTGPNRTRGRENRLTNHWSPPYRVAPLIAETGQPPLGGRPTG